MWLERLLFKKVEAWVLFLVAALLLGSGLFFGHTLYTHIIAGTAPPRLGQLAVQIAGIPSRFLNEIERIRYGIPVEEQRFVGESGFDFFYQPDSQPGYGFLLLSRRDGDLRRSVVELVDLNAQQIRHRWVLEPESWWSDPSLGIWPETFKPQNTNHAYRAIHPLLRDDGILIVKGAGGPLLGIDACARPVWMTTEGNFHHSTEMDANGWIWAPSFLTRSQLRKLGGRYSNEGLAAVRPDGSGLAALLSLEVILTENGMGHIITGRGPARSYTLHLNDVQPVQEDGNFWKSGDLLLSLRDQSMVLLYRPATGKIIWKHEGDWQHQHDVDILDDNTLSIFDNNAYLRRGLEERPKVEGFNRLYRVTFPSARPEPWMKTAFIWNEIRTGLEGLADWVTSGRLMIEETRHGRIMQVDEYGGVDWQFVNRARDGTVRHLNWSRHLSRETGESALRHLQDASCD